MTPGEIAKLTEQAIRAKALLAESSKVGEATKVTLDNYEETLQRFKTHMATVKSSDTALKGVLAAMGNAAPIMDQAFQAGDTNTQADGAANGEAVSAKPGETAHLAKVDGSDETGAPKKQPGSDRC